MLKPPASIATSVSKSVSVVDALPAPVNAGLNEYVLLATKPSVSANLKVEGLGLEHSAFKAYHSAGTLSE